MASVLEFVKRSWQLLKSKDTPWFYKLIPFLALVYIVWPADAVADIVPLLGQLDDAGLLAGLMSVFVWLAQRHGVRVESETASRVSASAKASSAAPTVENAKNVPALPQSGGKALDESDSAS